MSAVEETKKDVALRPEVKSGKSAPALAPLVWLLNRLSSVRFGVIQLILLVALSMTGMLIMQQNVEGFDKYYAELQPSQKLLYGTLGFFDIYHAWYFNALLLVLSLNIILASIDRFPKTWKVISHRKIEAGRRWLLGQQQHAEMVVEGDNPNLVTEQLSRRMRATGFKTTVKEKDGRVYVFGERGAWNRLGYLAVHVSLLTIFTGGFLTAQFGHDGQMALQPGTSSSEMSNLSFHLDKVTPIPVPLPFTVTCTDIEQKLIQRDGSIQANNTIDWLTRIRITDETGAREALVHLNEPVDYRGYRFFQASFIAFGQARHITLRLMPEDGGAPFEVNIARDGSTTLADGTKIDFDSFQPDFVIGQGGKPDSQSEEYNNPAAVLKVTTPTGQQKRVYAFAKELPSGAPVGAPFGGYKYHLTDFEKVPLQHVLSIQKDPGRIPFYAGGLMLILTLWAVFFFSHQRVWALVEKRVGGGCEVILSGNTNRNKLGFEDRFNKLVTSIGGEPQEVQQS